MNDRIGPPAPHVLQEEVGDDVVLYDSERHKFYEFNETASDVWRLTTGEFTLDQIVERLAGAYATTPDAIQADVTRIVEMMTSAGLFGGDEETSADDGESEVSSGER